MRITAPNIPAPKPRDEDYMKVWRKCLQTDIDNIRLSRERDVWRTAFFIVAAILFVAMLALIVFYLGYSIHDKISKPI